MNLEYRTAVDGEIKDADESKRQVLVTFPHERVDTYKTTFGDEAFRASFAQRMPTMAWMHDMKEPIGRAVSAQVMTRSNELVGQLSDFDAVPLARRAFAQIKDGSITDFSFGFTRISDEPHPEHRGVTRITKATMQEFSPVMVGSIPGAIATGTRSDNGPADGLVTATIEDILHLWDLKLIREDEARALLATHPEYREHIVITATSAGEDGLSDWDPDVVELLARSAGGMEAAGQYLSDVDVTTLPEPVQSAIALMNASASALEEARSIVGEPPDPAEGIEERAAEFSTKPWSDFKESDYTDAQYIAACLIKGKTKDDSALPVKEPDGTVNKNGVDAAAVRLGQVKASPADKTAAAKALLSLYSDMKEKAPGSLLQAARAEEIELEQREAATREKLARLG